MKPSMQIGRHEQRVILGAFLREVERLNLTRKLAARLASVTPQALYAWENVRDRHMRRDSAGKIKAATKAMRECKRSQRTELIASLANGNMHPFQRLAARTLWLREGE